MMVTLSYYLVGTLLCGSATSFPTFEVSHDKLPIPELDNLRVKTISDLPSPPRTMLMLPESQAQQSSNLKRFMLAQSSIAGNGQITGDLQLYADLMTIHSSPTRQHEQERNIMDTIDPYLRYELEYARRVSSHHDLDLASWQNPFLADQPRVVEIRQEFRESGKQPFRTINAARLIKGRHLYGRQGEQKRRQEYAREYIRAQHGLIMSNEQLANLPRQAGTLMDEAHTMYDRFNRPQE